MILIAVTNNLLANEALLNLLILLLHLSFMVHVNQQFPFLQCFVLINSIDAGIFTCSHEQISLTSSTIDFIHLLCGGRQLFVMYIVSFSLPSSIRSMVTNPMVLKHAIAASMYSPTSSNQLSLSNATNQISARPKCYGPGITVNWSTDSSP